VNNKSNAAVCVTLKKTPAWFWTKPGPSDLAPLRFDFRPYRVELLSPCPVGPAPGGEFDGDGVEVDETVVTPGVAFEAVIFIRSLMPRTTSPKARAAPTASIIPSGPILVRFRVAGSMRGSPLVVSMHALFSFAPRRAFCALPSALSNLPSPEQFWLCSRLGCAGVLMLVEQLQPPQFGDRSIGRAEDGKINAVVIGVGGFLGMGEHDIAVTMDKLRFVEEAVRTSSTTPATTTERRDSTTGAATSTTTTTTREAVKTNDWVPDHAVMSGTKDQLKAMPQFKYSDYN